MKITGNLLKAQKNPHAIIRRFKANLITIQFDIFFKNNEFRQKCLQSRKKASQHMKNIEKK